MKKTPYGQKCLMQSIVLIEGEIQVMMIDFLAQGFGRPSKREGRFLRRVIGGRLVRIARSTFGMEIGLNKVLFDS